MTCGQWNTQSSCRLPRRTTPHALHRAPAAQLLTLQHALALMAHGLSRSGITSTHRQPELRKYLPPRTSLPMRSPAAAHSWPPARAARRGPARDHSRPQDLGRWLKAHAQGSTRRGRACRPARIARRMHRQAAAPAGRLPRGAAQRHTERGRQRRCDQAVLLPQRCASLAQTRALACVGGAAGLAHSGWRARAADLGHKSLSEKTQHVCSSDANKAKCSAPTMMSAC